jgi:hypothetical protein
MVTIQVKVKEPASLKRKLAAIRVAIRKPITSKDRDKILEELVANIKKVPKYHLYPPRSGELEEDAYVKPVGNGIVIGSDLPYAGILEYGKAPQTASGKRRFVFEGYYPNKNIIAALMKRSAVHARSMPFFTQTVGRGARVLSAIGGAIGAVVAAIGAIIAAINPVGRNRGNPPRWLPKTTSVSMSKPSMRTDANSRVSRLPREAGRWGPSGLYKYGIYTVFARHIKAIPAHHAFSKTAKWAVGYLKKSIKNRIRKINRGA